MAGLVLTFGCMGVQAMTLSMAAQGNDSRLWGGAGNDSILWWVWC